MTDAMLEVRVACKEWEARDIARFELVGPRGAPLPTFAAGAHIDVHVPDAPGSGAPGDHAALVRQYSLCNDPSETHRYVIGVLRSPDSRGGSSGLHERVQVGDTLRISRPKNLFSLVHGARRSLLLAGGIGITPILCMAERLHALGGAFELHYSARSRERAAFARRMEQVAFASRVRFHFSDVARVNLEQLLGQPRDGTHAYVCGSRRYMEAALGLARERGWPEAQLHYEFFEGAVLDKVALAGEFAVKLARSGRVVPIASGQTIIAALEAVGVSLPFACGEGICGTCLTRVLEGVPDHRDMFLSPQEQAMNDRITPCCSRAKSPVLVLDL